jgi:hypothetical protein
LGILSAIIPHDIGSDSWNESSDCREMIWRTYLAVDWSLGRLGVLVLLLLFPQIALWLPHVVR